tara:strand:- start:11752 stop:15144 length:3393 start_codon:yes stop_codon:yes gene_type:complete
MEQQLISRLKVKPVPKSIKTVEVLLNKPDVKEQEDVFIKTNVIDKTKLGQIDREAFLEKIQQNVATRIQSDIRKSPEIDLEKQQETFKPSKRESSTVLILDITKIGKKLTIQQDNIDVTIDTTPDKSVYRQDRKTVRPADREIEGPVSLLEMKDAKILLDRIPKQSDDSRTIIKSSNYYLNNRELFINFINSLFEPYKQQLIQEDSMIDNPNKSCDKKIGNFKPLTHQKIVRDYINLYTPYRGLLLYHGLGSGKSCSSIGIAEGLKNNKQVIIMIPASLKANYISELKKCGDLMYKKTQYWEFIKTTSDIELAKTLSAILNISLEFIIKNGGAWFVNDKKKSNYDTLSGVQQNSLNMQLDEMISNKYQFIHYNGMRMSHLKALTNDYTINPFDNKVVIVDEAHNLISRIINKLKKPNSLSMRLYDYLMSASNCKLVFLSGTPIINYPNEISIMFNMLRGFIYTYYLKLNISTGKVNIDTIKNIFNKSTNNLNVIYDYIDYKPSTNILTITKNPFNFKNNVKNLDSKNMYDGVEYSSETGISNEEFLELIKKTLSDNKIKVEESNIKLEAHKALPDNYDDFKIMFMDDKNKIKNIELLKLRILGLTSYFPDIVELLPKYNKSADFEIIKIPMSDFQFPIYEKARVEERKLEKKQTKKTDDIYEDSVSTYRIFSRAFCNFVFPTPDIKRPFPNDDNTIESAIQQDNIELESDLIDNAVQDVFDADNIEQEIQKKTNEEELEKELEEQKIESALPSISMRNKKIMYNEKIISALNKLDKNREKYLSREGLEIYSPKFLNMYENIVDNTHKGLHLVYSQFRTLEGIGIFRLILLANGFVEFKLKRKGDDNWFIDITPENIGKPKFALYTGTETVEEREIIRNIFNNNFELVPNNIVSQVKSISENNTMGDIIKLLMITASGAEGINLKNVRYVHITEPYWHPVRIEQVIGRARRICSHQELEKELQTVKVFMYLMTFSESQLKDDDYKELRVNDKSKRDGITPLTSDEALYEISTIKEDINRDLLKSIKESAIDCNIHIRGEKKDNIQCFSIGNPRQDKFAYVPNISNQEEDVDVKKNKETIEWDATIYKIQGISYAYRKETGEVYDLDSYRQKNPILVGYLTIKDGKYRFKKI